METMEMMMTTKMTHLIYKKTIVLMKMIIILL
ncbi:unnamed protein product [Schistosoma margrebowiei]|uniref:Uncharacterized protein n=1 Tax=Schistosoma margrebowiei TaxID=48269 RepID=A0A3P8A8C7_9TREM|nr:unnamed protein product [Schistosoma margrebowiei]